MKILILANNDVGLYRFRLELIKELLRNHKVYISLPEGDFVKNMVEMGCEFIATNISRHGTNPIQDLSLHKHYKKIIKKIKPDVILTYTVKPNIYGGMASKRLKVPYIVNITGLGNSIENPGILQKIVLHLYKKGVKNAKKVFFQNEENMEFMIKHKIVKDNYDLLPGSGVNLEENRFEKYPSAGNGITFVTIGRILKDKGIFELLSAIRVIKSKYSNVTFKVIGAFDGDYKEVIDNAVGDGLIDYLGHRNDIHELIKNSHATIHPSYHEGTSNVLLETASCGRPILASNVPGCKNTFDDGISGLAFEAKDVDSLVNAIEKFINLPYEEKEKMGLMGRKKMEESFDRTIVVNKYVQEIDSLKKEGI